MIQLNSDDNNVSTTSHDKDSTPNTHEIPKTRQTTFDSNHSNPSKKLNKRVPKPQNQSLPSIISTKSQKSARSHRSYIRKYYLLSWISIPSERKQIQRTQSLASVITPQLINPFSDAEILQEIYIRSKTDTSHRRTLQPFWNEYCACLKICKNLEDSQSQIEYWTAKEEFLKVNKYLKNDLNHPPILRTKFQPPMPKCIEYLRTLSDTLVSTKLGFLAYLKMFLLILQYILNIVFISQQLDQVINFNSNSFQELSNNISKNINLPRTRQEYIESSTGIGYLVEFSFLAILIIITIFQLLAFFGLKSIINKGILFLNFITAIQVTAEFSLFKFIHLLNPSSYITEFHEPPLLDTISDFIKFTLHLKRYEPSIIFIYKIFYTVIIKPLFSLLGLMALYIKLLQVSASLEWLNRLDYDTSVFIESWNNPRYIINFLGLANNIAGLYGLQPNEERQAFFINHRIHEYDFVYTLLTKYSQNNQLFKGYWNIALYSVGIDYKDLNEIFWEVVYGESPDIYDDDDSLAEVTEVTEV